MNKRKIAYYLNCSLVLLGLIGTIISIYGMGIEFFEYYTQDSNFICFVISIVYVFVERGCLKEANSLKEGNDANKSGQEAVNVDFNLKDWLLRLRFLATSMVMLTFLIVIFVLAPMFEGLTGYYIMFTRGANSMFHLLCPLISFISFVFFECGRRISFKDCLIGLAPTLVYAIVTVILNYFYIIRGPYPFLYVHEQSLLASVLWLFAIILIAFIITIVLKFFYNLRLKRRAK